jgi:hypothetical protein
MYYYKPKINIIMKKILFLISAILPTLLFAQAPASSSGNGIMSLLVLLLVCILIFLVCREIVCWYWKINKMVSNQEEIIRLLKKIADEKDIPSTNQQTIDPFHK